MSCVESKIHELEYSLMEKCYVCKNCSAKFEILEEPENFERIAKDMIQYCKEMGDNYDLREAMIPIVKWIINLTLIFKKVYK